MTKAAILADAEKYADAHCSVASPGVQVKVRLQAHPVTVDVTRSAQDLAEKIVLAFAAHCGMQEALAEDWAGAAEEVAEWAESCAKEREELGVRLRQLEEGRASIAKLLWKPQDSENSEEDEEDEDEEEEGRGDADEEEQKDGGEEEVEEGVEEEAVETGMADTAMLGSSEDEVEADYWLPEFISHQNEDSIDSDED